MLQGWLATFTHQSYQLFHEAHPIQFICNKITCINFSDFSFSKTELQRISQNDQNFPHVMQLSSYNNQIVTHAGTLQVSSRVTLHTTNATVPRSVKG